MYGFMGMCGWLPNSTNLHLDFYDIDYFSANKAFLSFFPNTLRRWNVKSWTEFEADLSFKPRYPFKLQLFLPRKSWPKTSVPANYLGWTIFIIGYLTLFFKWHSEEKDFPLINWINIGKRSAGRVMYFISISSVIEQLKSENELFSDRSWHKR